MNRTLILSNRRHTMKKNIVENVPRYFEPFVQDCFINTYSAALLFNGYNPNIMLTEYLSFVFDEQTGFIGTNFVLHDHQTSVEFSEDELNSSMELVYLSATTVYTGEHATLPSAYKDRVMLQWFIHDDAQIAQDRAKQVIDSGQPVITTVDLFHMPYHDYYQKKHQFHSIVITGYDEVNQTYTVFDKYMIGNCDFDGTLTFEQLHAGRASEIIFENPKLGTQKRPIRNLWVELNMDKTYVLTNDKIFKVIEESCKRMLGETTVLGEECGLQKIDALRKFFKRKKETGIDDDLEHLLREHYLLYFKRLYRSRQRFKVFIHEISDLLPLDADEIIEMLEKSSNHWQILSTLALKLVVSKNLKIFDSLDKQLLSIIELEEQVIQNLNLCLKERMKAKIV